MAIQLELLRWISVGAMGLALGIIAFTLARIKPLTAPHLGSRGERRQRAMAAGGTFASIEPMVRVVGAWIATLPLNNARERIDVGLRKAGYFLGLTPDEAMALATLSVVGFAGAGYGLGTLADLGLVGLLVGAFLGLMLFRMQVGEERDRRFRMVNRGLPTEIDLASMCLGAGMDFPGALRLIVDARTDPDDVLRDELEHILRELELGHTRAAALRNFESRVPTEAVQEFVGAVVQAEEKGTPLAEVLRIQAGMLRMRRSILAEEAASRAGVLMMIPLLMLLGSILIILMGSMLIQTYDSGLV